MTFVYPKFAASFRSTVHNLQRCTIIWRASHKKISPVVVKDEKPVDIPKNKIGKYITADKQPKKGDIYGGKPFKVFLEKEKTYSWCSCGWSHGQPFCDGTHKMHLMDIDMKPVRFQVAESKDYYLCTCKQTNNRPFCDGSHKDNSVQEAAKNRITCF